MIVFLSIVNTVIFVIAGIFYFANALTMVALFIGMWEPHRVLFFLDSEKHTHKQVLIVYIGLFTITIILGSIFFFLSYILLLYMTKL